MSPKMPQILLGQSLVFLRVVVVFQGLYNSTCSSCSVGGVSTKTNNLPTRQTSLLGYSSRIWKSLAWVTIPG